MSKPIAILSASRTPMGGMMGSLSSEIFIADMVLAGMNGSLL